jgi:hypothetical protein
MQDEPRTNFVFVDLENRPDVDLTPLEGNPAHVFLFLGRNQPTLPSKLPEQIVRLPLPVTLIKVRVAGKNALDFALTFHLGIAVAQYPGARFWIISGDKKDFGRVVSHVTAQHVQISRHDSIGTLPFLQGVPAEAPKPVKKTGNTIVDKRTEIAARLDNPAYQSRPGSLTKLRAYLKAALGKNTSEQDVEDFIETTKSASVFTVSPKGRLEYTRKTERPLSE